MWTTVLSYFRVASDQCISSVPICPCFTWHKVTEGKIGSLEKTSLHYWRENKDGKLQLLAKAKKRKGVVMLKKEKQTNKAQCDCLVFKWWRDRARSYVTAALVPPHTHLSGCQLRAQTFPLCCVVTRQSKKHFFHSTCLLVFFAPSFNFCLFIISASHFLSPFNPFLSLILVYLWDCTPCLASFQAFRLF